MTATLRRRRPPRFQATTKVAKVRCEFCSDTILAGLAEGLTARVDLSPIGDEPAARAEKRRTFTLTTAGELIERDAYRIAAGLLRGPVHGGHRCPVARRHKAR
jgi:hypothetical protein